MTRNVYNGVDAERSRLRCSPHRPRGDSGPSGPEDVRNLIAAGFDDSVIEAGLAGGPTCWQADDLLNPISTLDSRIDFVLFRVDFKSLDADIVGKNPTDRTPSGLWPSDHAGVVSMLKLSTKDHRDH